MPSTAFLTLLGSAAVWKPHASPFVGRRDVHRVASPPIMLRIRDAVLGADAPCATRFLITAQQWVDPPIPVDDYPLTYTMAYVDSAGLSKYLTVASARSSLTSLLPTGRILNLDP